VVKWFRPEDFEFSGQTTTCPTGRTLPSNGSTYELNAHRFQPYEARAEDSAGYALRQQCLRNPQSTQARQLARFQPKRRDPADPSERMRQAIDSAQGRGIKASASPLWSRCSPTSGTTSARARFTLQGAAKVGTQWQLYCLVHNIETLAKNA
jgi:hypothetical protein